MGESNKEKLGKSSSEEGADIALLAVVWVTATETIEHADTVFLRLMRWWTRILSQKGVSGVVFVAFVSLIPIGFLYVMPRLRIESDVQDYFPDNSYYSAMADHVKEVHDSISADTAFLVRDVDFANPETRARISDVVAELNADDLVLSPYQSMFRDFDDFVDLLSLVFESVDFDALGPLERIEKAISMLNSVGVALSPNDLMVQNVGALLALFLSNATSGNAYYEGLELFLQIGTPVCVRASKDACKRVVIPADYDGNVVWSVDEDRNKRSVRMVRMLGMISYSVNTYVSVLRMNAHRATLANALAPSSLSANVGEEHTTLWLYGWMAFD